MVALHKQKVDLDYILTNEVGLFGWYQLKLVCLVILVVIFTAFSGGEYIFTAAKIDTRCFIPACDGLNPDFVPSWIGNAIPETSSGYEECIHYANTTLSNSTTSSTCPAELFDRTQTVPCEEYVYENKETVAYDFNLGCDEWMRSLIGTIKIFGAFIGIAIGGYISDKWGRRVALSIGAFNTFWAGLLRLLSPNYGVFVFLALFENSIGASAFTSTYILATELTAPKYRTMFGTAILSIHGIGQAILALIAWSVQDWKTLIIVLYAPMFVSVGFYWVAPESVRWLLSKGKFSRAEAELKAMAAWNGKQLSEETLSLLKESALKDAENIDKNGESNKKEPILVKKVFNSPVMLRRCCTTPIWWVTNTLIYYGISINAVSLVGNRYLNYAYVNLIEVPGYWTAYLLLDRVGRKPIIFAGYLICSVCLIVFILSEGRALSLAMFLIAKFAISGVLVSTYTYTAELYPTKYRQSLFGFSSMIGRIGSMTAPLTPALMVYWDGIPSALFASFALLSAALVLTTPETLNKKLPQDFHDAENLSSMDSTTTKPSDKNTKPKF